jgi:hypothetical protein
MLPRATCACQTVLKGASEREAPTKAVAAEGTLGGSQRNRSQGFFMHMHASKRVVFSSLVSPSEAAKICRCHPMTLLRWRRLGWLIPDLRIPGGVVAYSRPTLARFIANGGAEPFRGKRGRPRRINEEVATQ